ncbi:hypothetical protein DKX38_015928 [Salix brachista]|uniref:Uncharacterized protein n=1 Tax=Salix brachista TaxID=2182728 RepID=A0A5N5L6M1_9ROSI|nr:hypothetical protein DKX38_015928 [Salix brachista]
MKIMEQEGEVFEEEKKVKFLNEEEEETKDYESGVASFSVLLSVNTVEDMGTEYLVRPVGRAEDEEDASDFEPVDNGDDDDNDEEEEDDDTESAGKVEAPPKRKRSDKDDSDGGGGEDDERPSKR